MIKRVTPPDDALPGESRAARWSRLKQQSRIEKEQLPSVAPAEKTPALTATPHSAPTPATESEQLGDPTKDLPPLESLTKDSDYSMFMRDGVPDDKRAQALQKLWASDPAFREPFAFEMHMEDYHATFTPIDALKDSIYRIGRGFLTPEDLVAEKKDAEKNAAIAEGATAGGESAAVAPALALPGPESPLEPLKFPDEKEGQMATAPEKVVDKSDKPA